MDYMGQHLGAWQVSGGEAGGAVEFKLFFPDGADPRIAGIRVAGDFQSQLGGANWDFPNGPSLVASPHPEGTIWSFTTSVDLPKGFYQYKYLVTFKNGESSIVSDPCTRYGGSDHQNAAIAVGGSQPQDNVINPLAGGRKPLRDLVIYELHLDDFTAEYRGKRAPLDAARDKLDDLVALGINAILFMPWTSWNAVEFDWGYAPFQYFAVEYRYANDLDKPEEKLSWLNKLISACHDRGIQVIMDGVFNHVSQDFPYEQMYQNQADCPFTGIFGGAFPSLQDLNFNNKCTQELIRDVCLYWIDNFNIDGIRFDDTKDYFVRGRSNGIPDLLDAVGNHLDQLGQQNFSLTLEHLDESAASLVNTTRATSYWDNALYQSTHDCLTAGQIQSHFLNILGNDHFIFDDNKAPTIYLTNHDHSQVAWWAGSRDDRGSMDWYRTQPYAIALLTAPGVPMLAAGQEVAEDHWLPEDDSGSGRRVRPRPMRWKLRTDSIGTALLPIYARLIKLRRQYRGLRSRNIYPLGWAEWQTQFDRDGFGVDVARQIVIYHRWGLSEGGARQRFYIVLNFSSVAQRVTVPFGDNGIWHDLLNDQPGADQVQVSNYRLDFTAESNWGHIFFREG
jgi:pullulanase